MTVISYVVVGDTRREAQAKALANKLHAPLALDTAGRWGPSANHLRAWILGNTEPCDWICVIEDDAILCNDFLTKAEKTLCDTSHQAVSFYLGTNYPTNLAPFAEKKAKSAAERGDTWIELSTLNHAVAVAIRQTHAAKLIEYLERSKSSTDEAINQWLQMRRYRVCYPLPSLVDHLDEQSIIAPQSRSDRKDRVLPRKAVFFEK